MKTTSFVAALLVLVSASASGAETGVYPWFPWLIGPTYRHASTAEEGRLRGTADVVRSAGAANLMRSEAAINYEDARRKNMENRVYNTERYFNMRAINRAAREAERRPTPSPEDFVRYARARAPRRLKPIELDRLTGYIVWPALLHDESFTAQRANLDRLYRERAVNGSFTASQMTEAQENIRTLQAVMRQGVKQHPQQLYMESAAFLRSLGYEATLPSG